MPVLERYSQYEQKLVYNDVTSNVFPGAQLMVTTHWHWHINFFLNKVAVHHMKRHLFSLYIWSSTTV